MCTQHCNTRVDHSCMIDTHKRYISHTERDTQPWWWREKNRPAVTETGSKRERMILKQNACGEKTKNLCRNKIPIVSWKKMSTTQWYSVISHIEIFFRLGLWIYLPHRTKIFQRRKNSLNWILFRRSVERSFDTKWLCPENQNCTRRWGGGEAEVMKNRIHCFKIKSFWGRVCGVWILVHIYRCVHIHISIHVYRDGCIYYCIYILIYI